MNSQTVIAKKKRGPAPTGKGLQIVTRMQPDQVRRLDAWIATQGDELSRPEAVRRLVDKALAAEGDAPRSARVTKPSPATAKPARSIPPKAKPVRKTAPPKRRT